MKYKIYGWNHAMCASGFLSETYNTLEEAEEGVKENEWIMDEWEIRELSEDTAKQVNEELNNQLTRKQEDKDNAQSL